MPSNKATINNVKKAMEVLQEWKIENYNSADYKVAGTVSQYREKSTIPHQRNYDKYRSHETDYSIRGGFSKDLMILETKILNTLGTPEKSKTEIPIAKPVLDITHGKYEVTIIPTKKKLDIQEKVSYTPIRLTLRQKVKMLFRYCVFGWYDEIDKDL